MAKRKKREASTATPVNGSAQSFVERMREDSRKLRELRTACGHLRRVASPQPQHIEKFINKVFALAGIEESNPQEQATAAGA